MRKTLNEVSTLDHHYTLGQEQLYHLNGKVKFRRDFVSILRYFICFKLL